MSHHHMNLSAYELFILLSCTLLMIQISNFNIEISFNYIMDLKNNRYSIKNRLINWLRDNKKE